MLRYDDAALEALIDDIESDLSERKATWKGDAPEKGRQAVCAFANDLADRRMPGVLFVGVADDGVPTGLPIDDRLLLTLADIKTDGKIVPPPTLTVEKRVLKGVPVGVVTVQPADAPPARYDGRIWIRLGPRRGVATAQDERILNERRKHRDIPFDVQPVPSSTAAALDRLLFHEEYLPNAFAADVLDVALQQLTRNAVMHRAYEGTNAPVRVYWFDDRIEVHNPGGPFGTVTAENFGRPGVTDYRNPHLAEALKVLGFVQRFGVGIATAQAALRTNGNPPAEFQVAMSAVVAVVRVKP